MHTRTRARWGLAVLRMLVFVALVGALYGCSGTGGFFDPPGGLGTGEGDVGDGLFRVWGGASRSFARLDWWLGLAGGACILVGAYRALRADLAGAGAAIGAGIALFAINALVAILLPSVVWIVAIGTAVLGGVWVYTLATGRGTGLRGVRKRVAGLVSRVRGNKAGAVR